MSSSNQIATDINSLDSVKHDLQSITKENQYLRQRVHELEDAARHHQIKTTKIVREVTHADPETDEIVTEREVTTFVEELSKSSFGKRMKSWWKFMNPMRKQSMWMKLAKGLILSLLILGALYAVWQGLKGVGVLPHGMYTPVEDFMGKVYSRVPYLSRTVNYFRSYLPKFFAADLPAEVHQHPRVDLQVDENVEVHLFRKNGEEF